VDSISRSIPQVANTMRTMGQNYIGGSGSSYGMVILRLKPWDQRKGISNNDVIKELTKKTSHIREAGYQFHVAAYYYRFWNQWRFYISVAG
jgi:HAE1 family hydrophobic/amphiphilic exporter-1